MYDSIQSDDLHPPSCIVITRSGNDLKITVSRASFCLEYIFVISIMVLIAFVLGWLLMTFNKSEIIQDYLYEWLELHRLNLEWLLATLGLIIPIIPLFVVGVWIYRSRTEFMVNERYLEIKVIFKHRFERSTIKNIEYTPRYYPRYLGRLDCIRFSGGIKRHLLFRGLTPNEGDYLVSVLNRVDLGRNGE